MTTSFSFATSPERYHHIKLAVDGDEATITLTINPERGYFSDVMLKLNSYDLFVDIELADAIQRLRFEYPHVKVVTITSGHNSVFSAGANIYMLKKSSHALKVNFCKFTNETRLYIEEASHCSNKKFLCAINGTAAGGGYELALACDRIILIDDKAAVVSLPEVPLLGVLPGTGGLTRISDKRKIRRDLADVFCTMAEGVKGQKAKDWRLVDEIYPKSQWDEQVRNEITVLKKSVTTNSQEAGIKLDDIVATTTTNSFIYQFVEVNLHNRLARITIHAPREHEPTELAKMMARGSRLWLLQAFRELDDAILRLRFFHREIGLWEFVTAGDPQKILDAERPLYEARSQDAPWFLRELLLHIGRVYKRIDVSSRSLVCTLLPGSAYAGVLAELLFVADRSYALLDANESGRVIFSPMSAGLLPGYNEISRLAARFVGQETESSTAMKYCTCTPINFSKAYDAGLITCVLDEIDFEDEIRLVREERASMSPDALTAMEASLRFGGAENLATKIFGRLSAWQNWVFIRENATGPRGALTSYGEDLRAEFSFERT